MNEQRDDKERESDHGWYVEFSRGWWRRCLGPNKDKKESSKSSGMYHGSVTDEQARELEKIVSDYLAKGDQPPRFTAYGMRDFIARAIGYWKSQPGEKAKEEVVELTAMIERPTARSAVERTVVVYGGPGSTAESPVRDQFRYGVLFKAKGDASYHTQPQSGEVEEVLVRGVRFARSATERTE